MEKKNTILLTVVAIATLLVAIVGATFAYFTATTQVGGEGTGSGVADVSTATVSGARLELSPSDTVTYLAYPGGFAYASAMFQSVKVDGEKDPNEYAISYKVNLRFSNNTKQTNLSWKLYKSTEKFENQKTCELETTAYGTETRFYYTCTGDNGNYGGAEVPTASGIIPPNQPEYTLTVSDVQTLKTTDTPVYYYLVVDYPNNELSQDLDKAQTISAAITGVSDISSVAANS
ncbi:MAG: hypothetical protein NC483_07040 [Ruminococcus sp.]|nr:hypothetical protein [Ruminococcus sp.]